MKLYCILTGILLAISSLAPAQTKQQDKLEQYYLRYPEAALRAADSLYREGVRHKKPQDIIQSLILKTTFSLVKDDEPYQKRIREIETHIAQEKEVATRSILHSYVAELYQRYALPLRNYNATPAKELPEDMSLWSEDQLQEKLNAHLQASVKEQEALQALPLTAYKELLVWQEASEKLQPTVYDFLCDRFFRLYAAPATPISASLFCNAQAYTQLEIPDLPQNAVLHLYQQLLAFRLREKGQAPEALLMADRARLQKVYYRYREENRDTLYEKALQEMEEAYAGNPMLVEILADRAEILYFLSKSQQPTLQQKDLLEKALAICEKGLREYPSYPRIGRLQKIANAIKTQEVNIKFPKTVYPEEAFELELNYRNLTDWQMNIYRLPDNTLCNYQEWGNKDGQTKGEKIRQTEFHVNEALFFQDSTFRIEGLPAGIYSVEIKHKNIKKPYLSTLVSTRIFNNVLSLRGVHQLQVFDWNSGFPMANAKVEFYTYDNSKYRLFHTAYSDKEGVVYYAPPQSERLHYRISNGSNPANYLQELPYTNAYRGVHRNNRLQLLTDKSTYRPGETVYFKGYNWFADTDTLYALTGQGYKVKFRDVNNREIASTTVKTNKFGSFSGSFIIPANALNGHYRLCCKESTTFFDYTTSFMVADYKRPEFEIQLQTSKQAFYVGDTIRIKGKAVSFSGVQIAHTAINYEIRQQQFFRASFDNPIRKGEIYTDANGEFELSFQAETPENNISNWFSFRYAVKASLTDKKGETQQSNINLLVYSGKARPEINIPEQVNKLQPAVFSISLKDFPGGQSKPVRYTLSRLDTPSSPGPLTDTIIKEEILSRYINIAGQDTVFLQLQNEVSGAYLLTADCEGASKKQIFYLYSPQDKRPPIPTYKWLVKEKTECLPGEKARILFGTSLEDAYLQYEVFTSDKSVLKKKLHVSNEVKSIEIPYLKEYGKEVQVVITYLKNKQYVEEIIPLKLIQPQPELRIETSAFRDNLLPGSQESWELSITGGRTPFSEVLALMYDASLDKIHPYYLNFQPQYLHLNIHLRNDNSYRSWNKNFTSYSLSTTLYGNKKVPYLPLTEQFLYATPYEGLSVTGMGKRTLRNTRMQANAQFYTKSVDEVSYYEVAEDEVAMDALAAPAGASTGTDMGNIQLRENFQSLAFFYPQLQTDSTGKVKIRFTVPEALTRWKFIALASTPEMAVGRTERYITTSKPLMVRPNLPRFLRKGDLAEIKAVISNLSDSLQQGNATFELLIPGSKEVVFRQDTTFRLTANQNGNIGFRFEVPSGHDLLVCRISAKSGAFSDGEQHYLPVLSNEILVNTTLPIFATSAGKHTFSLKDRDAGKRNYRLTLEMTANPTWYAVQALPNLQQAAHENATEIAAAYYVNAIATRIAQANPAITEAIRNWQSQTDAATTSPLTQNEELKSILLETSPWALEAQTETKRIQSLAQLFDQNRLNYLQEEAIRQLQALQTYNGGWSWFKGMPASRFITANVLAILQRAGLSGQQPAEATVKQMQMQALKFLDGEIIKDFEEEKKPFGYDQVVYLYVRSLYREVPLAKALDAHKHFMALAGKHWGKASLYEKALLATAMYNYGFKEQARDILESLRQYATVTEDGMYWPKNKNAYYRNSAVQVHTAILEAFECIEGNSPEITRMKLWLLKQKQVQNWGSVPSTVDAIHALLLSGDDRLAQQEEIGIKIGSHRLTTRQSSDIPGYLKVSYQGGEITSGMLKTEIDKKTDIPSWGGLYLQSFKRLDEVEQHATDLAVSKKLYIEKINKEGKIELVKADGQTLKTGDKVIVRLILSLKRDMEYLHLKDLRAACFEPVDQLSGNQWQNGYLYYREVKDASTNFFFDFLPRGTHVIEYPVWVNQSGHYQDGIATLQSMYAPVYNAYSQAGQVDIE